MPLDEKATGCRLNSINQHPQHHPWEGCVTPFLTWWHLSVSAMGCLGSSRWHYLRLEGDFHAGEWQAQGSRHCTNIWQKLSTVHLRLRCLYMGTKPARLRQLAQRLGTGAFQRATCELMPFQCLSYRGECFAPLKVAKITGPLLNNSRNKWQKRVSILCFDRGLKNMNRKLGKHFPILFTHTGKLFFQQSSIIA